MPSLGSMVSTNADSDPLDTTKRAAFSGRADGVQVPKGGQKLLILKALQRGELLTVATALNVYGVYALSQRIGELKRDGWPILAREKVLSSGKRVSEYWMRSIQPSRNEIEADEYPLREASFYGD